MNNTQTTNEVKEVKVDFSKLVVNDDFNDYDFKKDFILSIRLSYGDEKQKQQTFKDYVNFLQNELKVIDNNKNVCINFEKSSSYYYVFKKNQNFDLFFNQLNDYLKNNQNEKLQSLLDCYNDLKTINFTIANFKEKKDKIKNFITFCKNQKLID